MDAILCPSLLFIDDENWNDENKRNLFTTNLSNVLHYLQKETISVLWNDDLETLLWTYPDLHPWFDSNNYALSELLHQCLYIKNDSCNFIPCKSLPMIVSSVKRHDIISYSLSLFHYLIAKKENASFIVDELNNNNFEFYCECHDNKLCISPLFITKEEINISEEIENRWNDIKNDSTVLTSLINLMIVKYFPKKKLIYTPIYDNSFLRSLDKITENKAKVIYSITKRLTLTPIETSKIKGFHDEVIKGTECTRSFRIDGVCRIYYEYKSPNIFYFKEYTGESGHDKGTRHT